MWLYCRAGFFSVVQHKAAPQLLLVRARDRRDLDDLRELYMPKLGKTIETYSADYPYRAVITKKHYSKGMVRISYDIDYTNFKTMTAKELGPERASAYHKVHSATMEIDDRSDHWSKKTYSFSGKYSSPIEPYSAGNSYLPAVTRETAGASKPATIVTTIDPDTGNKSVKRQPAYEGIVEHELLEDAIDMAAADEPKEVDSFWRHFGVGAEKYPREAE